MSKDKICKYKRLKLLLLLLLLLFLFLFFYFLFFYFQYTTFINKCYYTYKANSTMTTVLSKQY